MENLLWMPSACLIKMIVGPIRKLYSRTDRYGRAMRKRRIRLSFLRVNALVKIDTNVRLLAVDLLCIDVAHFGRGSCCGTRKATGLKGRKGKG